MFAAFANLFRPSNIARAEAQMSVLESTMDVLDAKLAKVKRREWADAPVVQHALASIGRPIPRTPAAREIEARILASVQSEQARRWSILRAEGFTLNSYGGVL